MYLRIPTVAISNTVDRSIAHKVISDLKNNLSIDSKAFTALENIFNQDTFRTGVNVSLDRNQTEIPIAEIVKAKMDSRRANEMNVGNPLNESHEIFRNKDLLVSTEFINTEMTITLEYVTKSKVNADELVNMMRDHHITRGAGFIHHVDYFYNVPPDLLGVLENIYSTGKVNYDDGTDFLDFLREGNTQNSITLRSDVNGVEGNVGLTVLGRCIIHGLFQVDLLNTDKDYDSSNNAWSVSLTYKFNYMSPESFIADYNMLVNNTLVDEKYIIQSTANPSQYNVDYELYNLPNKYKERNLDYLILPPTDNHTPYANRSTSIVPIMSVLCALEKDDKKSLFNLKDLYYYTFTEDVMEYLENNYEDVVKVYNKGYHSILFFDLYKDNVLISRNNLRLDEDLNLYAEEDLEITSVYRVVLSVLKNHNLLTDRARSRLGKLDKDVLKSLLVKIDDIDYRIADGEVEKYMIPVPEHRMITTQVSIVDTFFNKVKES